MRHVHCYSTLTWPKHSQITVWQKAQKEKEKTRRENSGRKHMETPQSPWSWLTSLADFLQWTSSTCETENQKRVIVWCFAQGPCIMYNLNAYNTIPDFLQCILTHIMIFKHEFLIKECEMPAVCGKMLTKRNVPSLSVAMMLLSLLEFLLD